MDIQNALFIFGVPMPTAHFQPTAGTKSCSLDNNIPIARTDIVQRSRALKSGDSSLLAIRMHFLICCRVGIAYRSCFPFDNKVV